MNKDDVAIPCGLVAKSVFTDEYTLTTKEQKPITIKSKGIAWETDLKYKFFNIKDDTVPKDVKEALKGKTDKDFYKYLQWYDMTDEHFIVWMRYAGLPTFRKLWGKIE